MCFHFSLLCMFLFCRRVFLLFVWCLFACACVCFVWFFFLGMVWVGEGGGEVKRKNRVINLTVTTIVHKLTKNINLTLL